MNKEILKLKIIELKQKLPMLCDSDYYKYCDLLQQYELELQEIEEKGEDNENII